MTLRSTLQDAIRPSTTRSTAALWAKSLLNAVLFFSIFVVALPLLADRLLDRGIPLAFGIRAWLAGGLAAAGLVLWLACLDAFSRHGRGTPLPADAPRLLVTRGPFRWTRNPIMLAELLLIWAAALWLASWGAVLYAVAVCIVAHVVVAQVEEPELRRRFGPSYAAYCRDVPRWLPRLRPAKPDPGDARSA